MKTKIISFTCIICLLCCFSFALTACQFEQTPGVVDAEINDKGELILIYQDGKEQNLGVVVGKDGSDGVNGEDGVLQKGDVLLSATVNGEKTDITRQYHIIDMMLDVRVGDVVALEILRGNEKSTVQITITEDCLTAY